MLRLPHSATFTPDASTRPLRSSPARGPPRASSSAWSPAAPTCWPNMKRRHQKAPTRGEPDGHPRAARHSTQRRRCASAPPRLLSDVAAHPAVRAALPRLRARRSQSISSPPLRNMGTIGGNLCLDTRCTYYNQTEEWRRSIDYCMKEEGTICWVATARPRCWAHTASTRRRCSARWARRCGWSRQRGRADDPVDDLYRDDGIDYLAKRPGRDPDRSLSPRRRDARPLPHRLLEAPPPRLDRLRRPLRRRRRLDRRPPAWSSRRGSISEPSSSCSASRAGRGDFLVGKTLDRRDDRRSRQAHPQGRHADGQHRFPDPVARHHGPALHRSGARARPRGWPLERLAPKHGVCRWCSSVGVEFADRP